MDMSIHVAFEVFFWLAVFRKGSSMHLYRDTRNTNSTSVVATSFNIHLGRLRGSIRFYYQIFFTYPFRPPHPYSQANPPPSRTHSSPKTRPRNPNHTNNSLHSTRPPHRSFGPLYDTTARAGRAYPR